MERAENTIRLLRVRLNLMVGQAEREGDVRGWEQFFAALRLSAPVTESGKLDSDAAFLVARDLTFNAETHNSIAACIGMARENARLVRSQLSSQLWEQINRLYLRLHSWQVQQSWRDERDSFLRELETSASLIQGLVQSSLLHDEGWNFVQLGAHLERALSVCGLLQAHFRYFGVESDKILATTDPLNGMGVLRAINSFESYCRVYRPRPEIRYVTTFLLLSSHLPHSVRFNVDQVTQLLQEIAVTTGSRGSGELNRVAGRLQAHLQYSQIDDFVGMGMQSFLGDVVASCDQIHTGLYEAYINYGAEETFA